MADTRNYKRRQYFIKKQYQTRFILKFCLILVFGAIVSSSLLILFSQDTLTSSYSNSRLMVENTARAILPAVVLTNLITLVLISVAAIGVVLLISHKIAGPLFRFEKELNAIGEGDLTIRVALRKKDQLVGMAESLNAMTAKLQRNLGALKNELEGCLASINGQSSNDALGKNLQQILERLNSDFKLE